MPTLTLQIVRHGRTVANDKGRMSGWTDVALSQEGIDELKEFKKTVNYIETDRYYSSDLSRAIDTFNILFGDSHKLDGSFKDFREMYFADLEHVPVEEIADEFYEHFLADKSLQGAETLSQFSGRIRNQLIILLDELVAKNEQSLTIVGHSGTIRVFNYFLLKLTKEQYREVVSINGLGHVFTVDYNPLTKKISLIEHHELTQE